MQHSPHQEIRLTSTANDKCVFENCEERIIEKSTKTWNYWDSSKGEMLNFNLK